MGTRYYVQVGDASRNQGIRSAVRVLVPAVGRADSHLREHLLDLVDLFEELLAREVAAVEGFGADGDGLDDILVAGHDALQSGGVCVEGFFGVGPAESIRQ